MPNVLNREQIEKEVEKASRLANQVEAPSGVYGVHVESDQDHDGNPMLVISVDVDDDPDPSDAQLDDLIDYENRVANRISDGGLASWPLVRLVPRT